MLGWSWLKQAMLQKETAIMWLAKKHGGFSQITANIS